jgi:hypothetical protein
MTDPTSSPVPPVTNPPYSAGDSVQKATPSFILIVLVNAAIAAIKQWGLDIPDSEVWTIATMGYGALMGFIHWIQNKGKKA